VLKRCGKRRAKIRIPYQGGNSAQLDGYIIIEQVLHNSMA
jgi:hypothetical protein